MSHTRDIDSWELKRREVEKILWKHYHPETSMNGEEASEEIMNIIDSELEAKVREIREDLKKMWNYPCSCMEEQKVCDHDFSILHSILSLPSLNINSDEN